MSYFKGFINEKDWSIFLTNLKNENQSEVADLMKRANYIIKGGYVFQNDWDMEKTNEIESLSLEVMDWDYNPKGDPEWTFMLNRHAFLIDVATAYHLTKDIKYRDYIHQFILAFITEAPLTKKNQKTSWRTIDASLRVVNWVRVFEIIPVEELFDKMEMILVKESLSIHLTYLEEMLTVSRGQSNWLVIEICGLVLGKLYEGSADSFEEIFSFLTIALELQLEADGLQREQSFMYHHEVLMCLLMIIHLLKRNEKNIPDLVMLNAEKMAEASTNFMTNNGYQVAFGDSDVESMIGLLEVAENVLNRSFLPKTLKTTVTSLFTKLFIGLDNKSFEDRVDVLSSSYFKYSGISVLRSLDNKNFTLFKCGPLGGGHGHDDLLHLELQVNNTPVLVDSGRYSYDVENHHRLKYKQASAHNTVTIDQQNFNRHTDAWNSLKVATPINQKFEGKENCLFTEGGHLGYFHEGVIVNRKVLYLESGLWIVSDEIFTNKPVFVTSHFHFATPNLEKMGTGYMYETDQVKVSIVDSSGSGVFIKEPCLISPEYNSTYESEKLMYQQKINKTSAQSFIIMSDTFEDQVISVPIYSEGKKMPKEVVEAFEICRENEEKEYIIIQHQEPDVGRRAYKINGSYVYGKVVYTQLDEKNKSNRRVVLD